MKIDFRKFFIIKNIILLIKNEIFIKILYSKKYFKYKNYKINLYVSKNI